MNEEHHKLAGNIYGAFNRRDFDALDQYFTEDFVEHEIPPGYPSGLAGTKVYLQEFIAAFPDLSFEVVDMISEDDRAACHSRVTGTHQGEFNGIPATGKAIEVGGVDYVRIRDGKIAEHWGYTAEMAMMMQLGVVPVPEQRTVELPTETPAR